MRQFRFLVFLVPALLAFTLGCSQDMSPTIVEGPVSDNGGFSPEELSGEGPEEETSGEY